MKEYKTVYINKGFNFSRSKELTEVDEIINATAAEGWELLQIISPNDLGGAMYGVFVREK